MSTAPYEERLGGWGKSFLGRGTFEVCTGKTIPLEYVRPCWGGTSGDWGVRRGKICIKKCRLCQTFANEHSPENVKTSGGKHTLGERWRRGRHATISTIGVMGSRSKKGQSGLRLAAIWHIIRKIRKHCVKRVGPHTKGVRR